MRNNRRNSFHLCWVFKNIYLMTLFMWKNIPGIDASKTLRRWADTIDAATSFGGRSDNTLGNLAKQR